MTAERAYRLLLRLLPRPRRDRYGVEMAQLFADLQADERRHRGFSGGVRLWLREIAGMGRFAGREWAGRMRSGRPRSPGPWGRPGLSAELRWAWRGILARRWRAAFVVVLLGLTLAANAVTFSVVDSVVFRPQPYPELDRLVVLDQSAGPGASIDRALSALLLDEWQKQTNLVAAAGSYLPKNVFLTIHGALERVRTLDVTVGLFQALGVAPKWGRGFVATDLEAAGGYAAVISEALAREIFDRPERAVGQRLEASGGPLVVVGVMPADFTFPNASFRVWRALDPAGPLTTRYGGGWDIMARLAPGVPAASAGSLLAERALAVGQSAGLRDYTVEVKPFSQPRTARARQTMLLLLLGGAMCLLLTACANVASLELALAAERAASRAVHLALGASRASLARVAALEGGLLTGAALALGLLLTWIALRFVTTVVPESMRLSVQNPIDLDLRVVWFAAAVAGLIWLLACVAPIAGVVTAAIRALLAQSGRTSSSSRHTTRLRRLLTTAQVAVAVALVVFGLLYARSYQALLRVDKGFDSSGVAVISTSFPPSHFAPGERPAFISRLTNELTALPGVAGVTNASPPPETGDTPSLVNLEIDGRPVAGPTIGLGRKRVDASYFQVIRLPLRSGRYLQEADPETNAVIPESFARRFWPDGNAVGTSFRGGDRSGFPTPVTVVGVVGDFRMEPTGMPDGSESALYFYVLSRPPAPVASKPATPRAPVVDTGGMYQFLNLTVRLNPPVQPELIHSAIRRIDPRLQFSVEMVDDMYAAQNADVLLASRVVGVFSALALLLAVAGVYGVIAFLVASRTREIGIRLALGAGRRDINRMLLASSARLIAAGAVVGTAGAYWGSRWIESQLFGVSRSDPLTYAAVIGLVAAAACIATWLPARHAGRIDPAITLRAD